MTGVSRPPLRLNIRRPSRLVRGGLFLCLKEPLNGMRKGNGSGRSTAMRKGKGRGKKMTEGSMTEEGE